MAQSSSNNPYNVDNAGNGNGRLFYGRKEAITWLEKAIPATVKGDKVATPIILHGAYHIGKTALLNQIDIGILGDKYFPIYIDLHDIALDSNNTFLWDIANTAYRKLNRKNIDIPKLRQTDFIANANDAFRQKFLFPATKAINDATNKGYATGQKLLILFDNLQVIMQSNKKGGVSSVTTYTLHRICYESNLAACLFTFEDSEQHQATNEAIFDDARMLELTQLSKEETIQLIRQPINYILVQDVANYIYDLTDGQPYYTQKICAELYERQQKYSLQQITVADVTAVVRAHPDIQAYGRSKEKAASYQIAANAGGGTTIRSSYKLSSSQKRFIFLGLAILLLFIGTSILWPLLGGNNNDQIALASEDTATPIVITIVSTQIQTVIPTPLPTETPAATTAATEPATAEPTETPTPSTTPSPTPTKTPSRYPELITRQQDGMQMVLIPAGTFSMGSDPSEFRSSPDERPLHDVSLDQFYIDKYEVNVEQYARFLNRLGTYSKACDNTDCAWPRHIAGFSYLAEEDIGDGTLQYFAIAGYGSYPINHVSWYGADLYCQSVGARLPTEAEWEYAAKGTDGRIYPWGDIADQTKAVYGNQEFDALQPVDALPEGASPFGIFGMAGSMWEWTADWYSDRYYAESPSENPQGPESGLNKVTRGGAWPANNEADRIRTANRNALAPDFISSTVGFRCARTP